MTEMTFDQFDELSKSSDVVPVFRTLRADTETPVSAFLKISEGSYSFLYESAEGGENWGRYSFIGSNPVLTVKQNGLETVVTDKDGSRSIAVAPIDALRQIIQRRKVASVPGLPRFVGGLVGYLGFGCISWFEPKVPQRHGHDPAFPDAEWMLVRDLVVFDNVANEILLVACADLRDYENSRLAFVDALSRIENLQTKLNQALPPRGENLKISIPKENAEPGKYEDSVEKIKEYIAAGDCMQVVLSRRTTAEFEGEPFELYRRLRASTPAPYLYYLQFEDRAIAGASPEVLVRLDGNKVTVRPIAGTRKRGATPTDDLKLEEDLKSDPKERAEHVMLLDLGRNDVGRVSQIGSVRIEEREVIERFSHVMHLTSQVSGMISENLDIFDVIASTFPAGTLSGAPKIRAMQIIDELEEQPRGPYGGAVGYIDFRGDSDFAITIRTLVAAGNELRFQAGGGIVADSNAEREYEETQEKLRGPLTALGVVPAGDKK